MVSSKSEETIFLCIAITMAHLPPRYGSILEMYEKLPMPNKVLDYVQCLTSVDKIF